MKTTPNRMNWLKAVQRTLAVTLVLMALRATAQNDDQAIQQHRVGTLIITAAPGAKVRVEQVRHEFWFGAALSSSAFNGRLSSEDQREFVSPIPPCRAF